MTDNADVAALAADVDELRTQLDAAREDNDQVAELRREVTKLAQGLELIANQIEPSTPRSDVDAETGDVFSAVGGVQDGKQPSEQPQGSAWVDMTVATAPDYLRVLAEWVASVVPYQYPPMELTTCWPRHPEVVQALADLRVMWLTLYRSTHGGAWMLMDWHLRWWPEMSRHVAKMLSRCASGHEDRVTRAAPEVPDTTVAHIAHEWAQRSHAPPVDTHTPR